MYIYVHIYAIYTDALVGSRNAVSTFTKPLPPLTKPLPALTKPLRALQERCQYLH